MGDVIDFSGVTIGKKYNDRCNHNRLLVDDSNRTIECGDCGAFIDPFSAFMIVMKKIDITYKRIAIKQELLNSAINENAGTIAAKLVEKSWRSKTMVPACPHCNNGILSSDNFGHTMISKKHELERRLFLSKSYKKIST